MTSEIAILNKSAIALAADSALTYSHNNKAKIYNTAQKLFTLSKYAPVGLMWYGVGEYQGIPWETVVKVYREKLARKTFATIEMYSDHFKQFLKEDKLIRDVASSKLHNGGFIRMIGEDLRSQTTSIDVNERDNALASRLATLETVVQEMPGLSNLSGESDLEGLSVEETGVILQEILSGEVSNDLADQVYRLASKLVYKNKCTNLHSGLVIAGFGDKELFPSLTHLYVDGAVKNHPRILLEEHVKITSDDSVKILPFAQTDTINAFVDGMDRGLASAVTGFVKESGDDLTKKIGDFLKDILKKDDINTEEVFKDFLAGHVATFQEKLTQVKYLSFIEPLYRATMTLPKEELAGMAESLVSLASFKQRVTLDSETVGGPIDVAVISKGDGFVWIKRKLYFKPELNMGFSANYFDEKKSNAKGK